MISSRSSSSFARHSLALFAVVVALALPLRADIVIDDFSSNQGPLSGSTLNTTVYSHDPDHASIFGNERNLRLSAGDVTGGALTMQVTSGNLVMTRPANSTGEFALWWDGDQDDTNFNVGSATPTDLTAGGTLNAVRIQHNGSTDESQVLRLMLWTDGGNFNTAVFRVPTTGGTIDLRLSSFYPNGTPNNASIRAVYLSTWSNSGAYSVSISSITMVNKAAATEEEVGTNDFRISNAGLAEGDGASVSQPAIAYNGNNEYLVVWSQFSKLTVTDLTGQLEIWGQRFNATTGAEVGSDFRISDMGGDADGYTYSVNNPDVVYNATSNEYLVVWRGDDNESPLVDGDNEIFGQRINASTGAEIGGDFRISFMGGTGDTESFTDNPAVAWDSVNNRYLVVWSGDEATTLDNQTEIWGRILSSTGTSVSADDIRISTVGTDGDTMRHAGDPDVAFDTVNGRYLVTWYGDHDADNATDIWGQFVSTAGAEVGSDFRISDLGDSGSDSNYGAFGPRLTFNATAQLFLVVFHGDDNSTGLDHNQVWGRFVNAATMALSGSDFLIGGTGPPLSQTQGGFYPDVVWDAVQGEYMVVWHGDDVVDNDTEIYGQRLGSAGALLGESGFRLTDQGPIGSNTYLTLNAAVATKGGRFAVVWRGDDDIKVGDSTFAENEIFGQLFEIAASASAATSTISANPTSIAVNGAQSQITVQAKDALSVNLTSGGDTVLLQTSLGTLGSVTDNGNGTYTATLTSGTVAGTATITGTLNGVAMTDDATVAFTPGSASAATTTISAEPTSVTANGSSASVITVQAKDTHGNNLTSSGGTVTLSSNLGTVGSVTNNNNGTYTAQLTSTTTGTATITGTIGGVTITDNATVNFTPGLVSAATTQITALPTMATADGLSLSTITVQAKDANGNNLTSSGGTVTLQTNLGTLSAVTNNNNGTYTATITSTVWGTATITGTIGGNAITDNAAVFFEPGPPSGGTSTINPDSSTVTADGNSSTTIRVQLRDANNNDVYTSGWSVSLSTNLGTLSAVTNHFDGTYSATISAPTTTGTATISGSVNGITIIDTATVTFTPGAASPTASQISASATSLTANGASNTTITVQLKDDFGNNLTASGGTVVLFTSLGSIGDVTNHNNGTYTATLTSGTTAGSALVWGDVNGSTMTDTATVEFIAATPTIVTRGDLSGDGKADVFFLNSATGETAVWLMNGTTVTSGAVLPTVSASLAVAAIGDISGDTKSDVVFRNSSTGENAMWLMNGTTISSGVVLPTVSTALNIVGTGDFNGDNFLDLLWWNSTNGDVAIWLMNASGVVSGAVVSNVADTNMKPVGVGDLDANGKADIVFRNQVTGDNAVWLMNGTSIASGAVLSNVSTALSIVGVSDLSGDGKADILFRNAATGDNAVWLMNGSAISSGVVLSSAANNLTVAAVGDFNGDTKADIFWRDINTGANAMWLMNGGSIQSGAVLTTVAPPMQVAGPK